MPNPTNIIADSAQKSRMYVSPYVATTYVQGGGPVSPKSFTGKGLRPLNKNPPRQIAPTGRVNHQPTILRGRAFQQRSQQGHDLRA